MDSATQDFARWQRFGRHDGSPHCAASSSSSEGVATADAPPPADVSPPPLPGKRVVVGCGSAGVDYLALVASFPKPDDKIRTTDLQVQGGGNVGNALTAAARLGLKPRIISKVADDTSGKQILAELETDGVDTSHMVVGKGGISPFTYIIVDQQTSTRTCIHTPGQPPMVPKELPPEAISKALDGADMVYFDSRLADSAILLAQEASQRGLPILVDAERPREGLDDLLSHADFIVTSERFPQPWTGAATLPAALLEVLGRLPRVRFVTVTLGAAGCAMLERCDAATSAPGGSATSAPAALDVDEQIATLQKQAHDNRAGHQPQVLASDVGLLTSAHVNIKDCDPVIGRVLFCTAQKLGPLEVVDTTGAGDAFIGAVLYALCAGMPTERLLVLGATVAGAKCRVLGARPGLPLRTDARVAPLLL